MSFPSTLLVLLLGRHKSSLKTLVLEHVTLFHTGWDLALQEAAATPNVLSTVSLQFLCLRTQAGLFLIGFLPSVSMIGATEQIIEQNTMGHWTNRAMQSYGLATTGLIYHGNDLKRVLLQLAQTMVWKPYPRLVMPSPRR
ncbi:hypothetical protein BT63DRAFT_452010 [Microthyrium microscopicum]|uniref:Uncharacterized protein n=1 Tax=Microthyrium microscopicum TaxID=703497 RepID=A0A6A6USM7_9PEZI|nr:hypothetical protein BT63DRAFT_452010 [Microthyrium microscopicum]